MDSPIRLSLTLLLASAGIGCGDTVDKASNAVGAAKAMMEAADEMQQAGEAANAAAAEAEAKARAEVPKGASPEQAEQFVQQAKALAALQAMQTASGSGPITNWRQLEPFLPDALGDYAAEAKLKGSTSKAAGYNVTQVERSYAAGERRARVSIADASLAPLLKAPFKMAAMIEEDSTEGFKKGTRIQGHTAIVEWREASKRSKATILVGDRFLVDVKVNEASADDDATKLATAMDLAALAKVEGEEKGSEPAAAK